MPTIEHISSKRPPIAQPPCPKCATQMDLLRIESDKPGFDFRTFECPNCGHSEGRFSWRPLH